MNSIGDHAKRRLQEQEKLQEDRDLTHRRTMIGLEIQLIAHRLRGARDRHGAHRHLGNLEARFVNGGFNSLSIEEFRRQIDQEFSQFGVDLKHLRDQVAATVRNIRKGRAFEI